MFTTVLGQNAALHVVALIIPAILSLFLVGAGVGNIRRVRQSPRPFFCRMFDDRAFLSGQQAGFLGVTYVVAGALLLMGLGVFGWGICW